LRNLPELVKRIHMLEKIVMTLKEKLEKLNGKDE
jgi:hypothetical protein